jgi:hypothetical protein
MGGMPSGLRPSFLVVLQLIVSLCVGVMIWHGMYNCSRHMFMMICHNLSLMVGWLYIGGPCSLIE